MGLSVTKTRTGFSRLLHGFFTASSYLSSREILTYRLMHGSLGSRKLYEKSQLDEDSLRAAMRGVAAGPALPAPSFNPLFVEAAADKKLVFALCRGYSGVSASSPISGCLLMLGLVAHVLLAARTASRRGLFVRRHDGRDGLDDGRRHNGQRHSRHSVHAPLLEARHSPAGRLDRQPGATLGCET